MKTKELMIDDWVQVPSELNRFKQIKSTFDMDEAVLYQPIPITEEILKKNGFVNKTGFYLVNDGIIVEYTADERHDNEYWAFSYVSEDYLVSLIVMHYVHELQHALRLCKIEKEIEIEL